MDIDGKIKKKGKTPDDEAEGTDETSFAQGAPETLQSTSGTRWNPQRSRMNCRNCGGRGHTADQCPTPADSNSNATSATSNYQEEDEPLHRPTPGCQRIVGWYGAVRPSSLND